jgi:selenocysteine-specific elongation factor
MWMQNPFLLIFCGIPCSGKSTLAQRVADKLENKYNYSTVVITSDTFRHMVPTSRRRFEPELEHFVRGATYRTIQEALRWGLIVISDDINYYRSIRRQLKRIADRAKADYAIIYVNTPLELALTWNKKRGEPIPNSLIEEIYYKLDKPGVKYRWDTPLLKLDPSKDELEELSKLVASKVHEKACKKKEATVKKGLLKPLSLRADLDRETRRAMGEVMKRYGNLNVAREISDLRKRVVEEALEKRLSSHGTTSLFFERAESILKHVPKEVLAGEATVHIGLFGHVDHGKTQLARCLTEKPSTAALDKHPQAQERGMSIDIGFSAFNLGKYVATLVDLPGHHSLIKHVVAGANIIDLGILVIAANEGPKVQTIEHLHILTSLGIEQLVVAINKTDLVNEEQLDDVKSEVENLLVETPFKDSPTVCVSAIKCENIQQLKKNLVENISFPVRQWSGNLKIPISHSFHISGMGTVVTGTILRGKVKIGDKVEIVPNRKDCKVRSIQIFGRDVEEASAGDRVGLALTKIRSRDLSRGDIIVSPSTLEERDLLDVELEVEPGCRRSVCLRDLVHVSVGLKTAVGRIYPYTSLRSMRILKKKVAPGQGCRALIKIRDLLPVETGDKALLMKLDLSPKQSRIIGVAEVADLPTSPKIYSAKIRRGYVQEKTYNGLYIVSGLFATEGAAQHVAEEHKKVFAALSKTRGTIIKRYGNKGDVLVNFESPPDLSEEVYYYRLRGARID